MFQIDTRSTKPIYEQIIDKVQSNVVKGHLKAGDELPSVRKMARQLSVTPNTVAKAYRELERNQVIEVIQGKGTYISRDYQPQRDEGKLAEIQKKMEPLIVELIYQGYSKTEISDFVQKLYEEKSSGENNADRGNAE